ncbi:DUF2721 domain-containing protein [Marinihelvus fidelis]|uniref:DUF2721 domain-containing protein n=1 Tax=Marinihelvus fidelis TaxID=2613842 RepID=A0A5N0TCM7_9GAMM|nr:DUF2721 domain-containing protein [Marinihelvus fidelis]KAA9132782.1 DUF2721 domain-containing protein [Marinihelvus fidelis]
MILLEDATDIAHVIELAVAPVFLLAGIGAFINAFAARLGRVFDRGRLLEDMLDHAGSEEAALIRVELAILWRRARLANIGIALDILSALIVCILIAVAFAGFFFDFEIRAAVASLFILAMLALIGGLVAFLWEVYIAVRRFSFGIRSSGVKRD